MRFEKCIASLKSYLNDLSFFFLLPKLWNFNRQDDLIILISRNSITYVLRRKTAIFFIGGQHYWCSSENFLTYEIPCGFVLLPFYLMLSGILSNYARVIQFLELPPQAKTANDSHSTAQRWILIRFKQNKKKM